MTNVMKKKLLPSMMAIALGVGFSAGVQAINLAEDGIGQTLLAPLYLTEGNYKTSFSITNTSPNSAVKAKIVLRSQVDSEELLDFICYLTPSDVCRFELIKACATEKPVKGSSDEYIPAEPFPRQDCEEDYKHVFLHSTDDSVKSPFRAGEEHNSTRPAVDSLEKSYATFASLKPVVQGVFLGRIKSYDNYFWGHVEAIGVYGVRNGPNNSPVTGRNSVGAPTFISITRGMSKFGLAQIFDTPRFATHYDERGFHGAARGVCLESSFFEALPVGDDRNCSTPTNGPYEVGERLADANTAPFSALQASRIRSTDPSWVRLMGMAEIVTDDESDRMAYRIPALAGRLGGNALWNSDIQGGFHVFEYNNASTWDGLVVSNPTFDVRGGASAPITDIGILFGVAPESGPFAPAVRSKVVEIEAALAATRLQGTYEDEGKVVGGELGKRRTHMVVTFPTRYLHKENVCSAPVSSRDYYPPFPANGGVTYDLRAYDESENVSQTLAGTSFSGGKVAPGKALVEVNYFMPQWPETVLLANGGVRGFDYRKGWFEFGLTAEKGCDFYYQGLPVLGLSHKYFIQEDGRLGQSMMLPLSHEPIREGALWYQSIPANL